MLESTLRSDLVSTGATIAFSNTAWIERSPLADPLSDPLTLTGSSSVSAIAFVDATLPDYQTLVDGLSPKVVLVVF